MLWEYAVGDHLVVEIHDAVLAGLERRADALTLILSEATLFRSTGRPGFDPGTCWHQGFRLHLATPVLVGDFPAMPTDLMDATLRIGEEVFLNLLPLGPPRPGAIRLDLIDSTGAEWSLTAARFEIEPVGDPDFAYHWPDES